MKVIVVLKKKKDNTEIDRMVIQKLEMMIEEIPGVDRANFDSSTFKLYADVDEDYDDEISQSDFNNAINKGGIFRAINISFS